MLVVKKVGKFVGSKFCFHRIIGKERLEKCLILKSKS